MPSYTWQHNDTVTAAKVKENLSYRYALLHLNGALAPEQLSTVREKLQEKGLTATPDADHGEALLRVRGFKKATELFETLHELGFTSRSMPIEKAPLEEELHEETRDIKSYIKKHSIELAGWSYLVADAMPILSGLATKNSAEVVQGGMWATTSAALVAFGRKNPDFQMGLMYDRMKQYLYQEGIDVDIEDRVGLERLRTKPHYWNKMINWLYENPVLFNNTLQGVGGLMQAKAGAFAPAGHQNHFKTAAGLSVTAGQWAGMLVPEEPHISRSQEDQTAITKDYLLGRGNHEGAQGKATEGALSWVREKPLRLTAIGPGINNILAGIGAMWYDRKQVHEHFGADKGGWLTHLNPFKNFKKADYLKGFEGGKYGELLAKQAEYAGLSDIQNGITGEQTARMHTLEGEIATLEAETQSMLTRNKARRFIAVSPVFNLIANTLYGMSSKEDRSEDLANVGYLDEMVTMAANVYAPFPEEERAVRVSKFAGFVAYQPDIHINREQVSQRINDKISELQHSPWVQACRSQVAENCEAYEQEMAVLRGERAQGEPKKPIDTAVLSTKHDTPASHVHEAALQERMQHAAVLGV